MSKAQTQYPWEIWTSGWWYTVYPEEDFTCSVQTFKRQLYNNGRKRRMFAEILDEIDNGRGIIFRFWKEFQDGDGN
jgi:hypothetical protein